MKLFEKILSECITFIMTFLITMLAFGNNLLTYYGKNTLLMLAALCFPVAGFIYLLSRICLERIWKEIVVISVLPMLFVLSSMVFRSDVIDYNTTLIYWFFGIFFCTFYIVLQHAVQSVRTFRWVKIRDLIITHRMMIFLLFVLLLLRLPFLNILPRWDSGEYYYRFANAVKTFQYTGMKEYIKLFALCGHPTLAFCFVYMIGDLIAPGHIIGVSLISLGLTVVGMCCVYRILLKICRGITPAKAAIFTFILSMAPLLYSTNMYFNPDYAMAIFFIFVVYGYVYHKPFLTAVSSLLCFQTKETGLVLVGGYVLGVFVQHYRNRENVPFLHGLLTDLRLYCTLTAAGIQFLYNRFIGGLSNWSQSAEEAPGLKWNNTGSNCLGFNLNYISVKLKQQFILNFNWVIVLIILICLILLFITKLKAMEKGKRYKKDEAGDIYGIVVAFIAFVAFSCLYITAPIARYNVAGDVLLYLIMFYVLSLTMYRYRSYRITNVPYIGYASAALLFIMLAVQCFITIDPLTRSSFLKLDAGNTDFYFVGNQKSENGIYYGDYLIYNTQFTYIDRAYNQLLKDSDFDPDTCDIILASNNGAFMEGNTSIYSLNWDSKTKKRVFYQNKNTTEMNGSYQASDIATGKVSRSILKKNAILVCNPYWIDVDAEEEADSLSRYYNVSEQKVAKTMQGSIYYYELTKK